VLFESSDMAAFHGWAAGIAAGDVLDREAYRPERVWHTAFAPRQSWREWYGQDRSFYKAPAYTYVVAGSRALFGANLMGPLALLQIAAAALSTFLIFSIGRRLFGQAAGVAAAGLYAVFGPGVHYDVLMLRHAWIVLTLLAVTLALLHLGEQPSFRSGALLGLGLGAAMLVKVSALSTALVCVAVAAWWLRRDRARLATVVVAVALGFAIALAPWLLRNALVGAPLAPRVANANVAVALCNAAGASPYTFDVGGPNFVPVIERGGGGTLSTLTAALASHAGPAAAVVFYARRGAALLIPFEIADNANYYHAALRSPLLRALLPYAALLPLAAMGVWFARRSTRTLLVGAPAVVSLLIGIMLTAPLSRFRAPLAPFLCLLAGLALARLYACLRSRNLAQAAAPLALGALVVLSSTAASRAIVRSDDPLWTAYRHQEFAIEARFLAGQRRFVEAAGVLEELALLSDSDAVRASALVSAAPHWRAAGRPTEALSALDRAEPIAEPELLRTIRRLRKEWEGRGLG